MKVFLKKKNSIANAVGEFDERTKELTVLKGSIVSEDIACSEKFERAANSIAKRRAICVKDNVVTQDVVFKSPSTAANFVTGRSCNGLLEWKDNDGRKLKDILAE